MRGFFEWLTRMRVMLSEVLQLVRHVFYHTEMDQMFEVATAVC